MALIGDWTKEQVEEVKDVLERLARGDTVTLGEFGDGVRGTDADDQAAILREIAYNI